MITGKKVNRMVAAGIAVLCLAATAWSVPETISIKFGLSADNLTGSAGAAAYTAGNWNNATGPASGTLSNLTDAAGDGSGVNLSWSTDEIWRLGTVGVNEDEKLMRSFLNDKPPSNNRGLNSSGPSTVTLTNLPGAAYTLVVYSDGDEINEQRVTFFEVDDGSGVVTQIANDMVQYPDDGYVLDSGLNYRTTGNAADYGNYLVFEDLSGTSLTINFYGENDISWRGHLNGIQLVFDSSVTTPDNLTVGSVTSNSVELSWDAAFGPQGVSGYYVYRDGMQIADVAGTEYTDTCLNADTQYAFQVSAYDTQEESGLSETATATTAGFADLLGDGYVNVDDLIVLVDHWLVYDVCPMGDLDLDSDVDANDFAWLAMHWTGDDIEAPTVPQNLTITGETDSTVNLSWAASTDNFVVLGYHIYRDGILAGSSTDTEFTDTGLAPDTAYAYTVTAYDAAGNESALSNTANARTAEMPAVVKPRVIVMTDFGRLQHDGSAWIGDPDDYQSMTRFLLYANQMDIEGLVCVTSNSVKYALYPDELKAHIDAYGQVRSNLLLHEDGYPTAEELKSLVKSGNVESSVYGMDAVGPGKSSEGSNWIISVVDDNSDSRPVHILAWGGTNTLAQALQDVQASRTQAQVNEFLSRIRVYPIAKQDSSYDWLISNYVQAGDPDKQLFWIDGAAGVWKGLSAGPSTIYDVQGGDESLVSHQWIDSSLRNKGPLSVPQRYPYHTYIMEGDTPSFFYLLPTGIGDPAQPNLGGWGGRYSNAGPKHTAQTDNVNGYSEIYASIWRWREHFQNDFEARMDWCVQPYSGANHPPVVIVDGALERSVSQGTVVHLDAQNTYDPDADNLSFEWIQYSEADTYGGTVSISGADTANASFTAPSVSSPRTIQMLLIVTDDGSPNLTRYKQVVITVNP